MKPTTSIIYSNNRGMSIRFILSDYRNAMYLLEGKMEKANCEPLLVVEKANPKQWWLDDICMVADLLGIDELMGDEQVLDNPVVQWLEKAQELKEGETMTCDFKEQKQKLGISSDLVLTATASTDPCDEAQGQCTNDCEPIEL